MYFADLYCAWQKGTNKNQKIYLNFFLKSVVFSLTIYLFESPPRKSAVIKGEVSFDTLKDWLKVVTFDRS